LGQEKKGDQANTETWSHAILLQGTEGGEKRGHSTGRIKIAGKASRLIQIAGGGGEFKLKFFWIDIPGGGGEGFKREEGKAYRLS